MGKVKCKLCCTSYDTGEERCPSCGAVNPSFRTDGNRIPETIEELKAWYADSGLPPEEVTRFFIGQDIKEPKAFGIYKDSGGTFVVYKNKANGSRAVRYQGTDEAFAVNELYQRLNEEILNQERLKQKRSNKGSGSKKKKHSKRWKHNLDVALISVIVSLALVLYFLRLLRATLLILPLTIGLPLLIHFLVNRHKKKSGAAVGPILIGVALTLTVLFCLGLRTGNNGYYIYGDSGEYIYYKQNEDWYFYGFRRDDWYPVAAMNTDYGVYSETAPADVGRDFQETDYYNAASGAYVWDAAYLYDRLRSEGSFGGSSSGSSDSYRNDYDRSWDFDSGWDSGSDWDSGGTDWDSDW